MASFGLLFIIQNLALLIWKADIRGYSYLDSSVSILGAVFAANRLVALLFAVVISLVFYFFLTRTRLGKAIRAAAEDPATAQVMGVNIHRVLAICFGLGALMAGFAGPLISMMYEIQPTMGLEYTIIAIIVVVLGGLGSITGSLIGGFILGLIGSIVTYFDRRSIVDCLLCYLHTSAPGKANRDFGEIEEWIESEYYLRNIFPKAFFLRTLFLILILLATLPLYVQPYLVILLTTIFMYIIITVSWTIFSGPTRYISLASAAFFGVGVYTSALLGKALPLPVVIVAGSLFSFILALFIGLLTLRLRGMYFIIFTFSISELIRHFLLWWETTMTGTVGRWVVMVDHVTVYYVILVIFVLALLTAYLIRRSRFGLALRSIGEQEEAATHIGINATCLKTIAFAISAFFMGATGAIMATKWKYIDPRIAFDPLLSFMPVLMAIFGGTGQLYGPVFGRRHFCLLEEILTTKFPYYYMLLFGSILIVVILFLPHGMVGLVQKWRKGGLRRQNANP